MNLTFLEAFLFVNVFVIGGLLALALQHAYIHFKHRGDDHEKNSKRTKQDNHLPPELREKLIQDSEEKYRAVINHSASDLENDLQKIANRVDGKLEKLSSEIVDDETKRYQTDISKMRKEAETAMILAQKEIVDHQQKLKEELEKQQVEAKAKLEEEIAAEKDKIIQQIDTKLADGVTSFLIETLGHNVDLGAQNAYLIKMLEEHKAELTKGIKDEA